jgi:hypothetical protein
MAVGSYITAANKRLTLVERWNGFRWRVQPSPNPPRVINHALPHLDVTGATLSAVSCASLTACIANGSYWTSFPGVVGRLPLIERWNGRGWTIERTARLIAGVRFAGELSGVSCVSPRSCVAVGMYYPPADFNAYNKPLIERWNGRNWAIQQGRTSAGTRADVLTSVSCVSNVACTAVGSSERGVLIERWNGMRWQLQRAPTPRDAGGLGLSGVSCASGSMCMAVGGYILNGGSPPFPTFAERWSGTAWQAQRTPNPAGGFQLELTGVSCPIDTACVVVGSDYNGHTTLPLIEGYS